MTLPIHKYYSLNGQLQPTSDFTASEDEGGIYEVIRIIKGIPLFWEEHIKRFSRSAEIATTTLPFQPDEIKAIVNSLVTKNQTETGNVMLSWKSDFKAFFIPHHYPAPAEYREGVTCGILFAERKNPNAKIFQTQVRRRANKILSEQKLYEVLLTDNTRNITEGSRSNVFFIRNEKLITPLPDQVLLGVTRQKTIECAQALKINIEERKVALSELPLFDSVFITGTSPNILPVKNIGENQYDVNHPLLRKLMFQFEKMHW